MFALKTSRSGAGNRRSRTSLRLEQLESRVTPAATGNAWPDARVVTISFVPDGTLIGSTNDGYVYSNLFEKFNAKFGSAAAWQKHMLRGAQVWAQQTNINFAVVSDNGTAYGQGLYQQGDPEMGDIRIGGYVFGNTILASAFMPPPANNYSIAGDQKFNTGMAFNINGMSYDLFTVAAHEFGHSIGLGHSNYSPAVMYAAYNGVKSSLYSDDIVSARSVYGGARVPDSFDAAAANNTIGAASDINAAVDPVALTGVVSPMDITATSDVDFYKVTAPLGTTGSFTVQVQSKGLSLLAPRLIIYAANKTTILGSVSGAGSIYGTTLRLTISNVVAGQQLYLRVSGTDSTAFSTGKYGMTLNFGLNLDPTIELPNTTLLNGEEVQAGGGIAMVGGEDRHDHDHDHGHDHDHDEAGGEHHYEAGTVVSIALPAPAIAPATAVAPVLIVLSQSQAATRVESQVDTATVQAVFSYGNAAAEAGQETAVLPEAPDGSPIPATPAPMRMEQTDPDQANPADLSLQPGARDAAFARLASPASSEEEGGLFEEGARPVLEIALLAAAVAAPKAKIDPSRLRKFLPQMN